MKWITREHVKVDRVACPWLIKRFVDTDAEFLFVPADEVMTIAEREGATPFDVKGVELGHHGQECSFEAILKKYHLTDNPTLVLLGKVVNAADTDNTLWNQPEGTGLHRGTVFVNQEWMLRYVPSSRLCFNKKNDVYTGVCRSKIEYIAT